MLKKIVKIKHSQKQAVSFQPLGLDSWDYKQHEAIENDLNAVVGVASTNSVTNKVYIVDNANTAEGREVASLTLTEKLVKTFL